jgi:hypothetical protein
MTINGKRKEGAKKYIQYFPIWRVNIFLVWCVLCHFLTNPASYQRIVTTERSRGSCICAAGSKKLSAANDGDSITSGGENRPTQQPELENVKGHTDIWVKKVFWAGVNFYQTRRQPAGLVYILEFRLSVCESHAQIKKVSSTDYISNFSR